MFTSCGVAVRNSQNGMVRQTLMVRNAKGQKLGGIKVFVNGVLVGTSDAKGRLKHQIKAIADAGFIVGDVAFF